MRYKCETGHVIKRNPGTTRTKCGWCRAMVDIAPLPPDEQHNYLVSDNTQRFGASVSCREKSKRQSAVERRLGEALSVRVSITGQGD
jgi:hypothetical protein